MGLVKRFVVASVGSVLLATCLPTVAATAQTKASCWDVWPNERGFANDTNRVRAKLGKPKLQLDPQLSRAARLHAREMAKRDVLYHTPGEKITKRVTNWSMLGENVGVGYSVDSLQDAFLNSPGHRANMISTGFKYFGVGSIERNGKMWVTVIFEGSENPGTSLKMPNC
ncbi:MAG TPA: CAP domain-containing protein [Actinomycetota bacterium]|jgi:uncharacterized protein YkwD